MDINNSLVQKKWGSEYLLFRNANVAIWKLFIKSGEETSFHCHPNKKTGLIVLDGAANISFLNNTFTKKGLDKVEIFPGRFHKTQSLSKDGTHILEVESPEDKFDLIRLFDKYGRQGQAYENNDHYLPLSEENIRIMEDSLYNINNCWMQIQTIVEQGEISFGDFEETYVCLSGGLGNSIDKLVVKPGDVISVSNLKLLLEHFPPYNIFQFLKIWK